MKHPFFALGMGIALEALVIALKWLNWLPSWSTVIFFGFFMLGLYRIWEAFSNRGRVSFHFVWGFFFFSSSLAFLGQEFGIWHFWTLKNFIVMLAFFFSLGLFASTFFFKNFFLKVLMIVPAVFLLVLTTLAFLTFYRYIKQAEFVPLWQVNTLIFVLFLLWTAGEVVFAKRKDLSKPA